MDLIIRHYGIIKYKELQNFVSDEAVMAKNLIYIDTIF